MARKRNDFTNHEVEIIRKHWPTTMPLAELLAMLPRHSKSAVTQRANKMKLYRPRVAHAWLRLRAMLEVEVMTQDEIAAAMDVTRRRVHQFLVEHRAEVYIKSWRWSEDRLGIAALWALGNSPDAPKPMGYRRWREQNRRHFNPFLAAAGLVQAPTTEAIGRVYRQAMSITEDEEETV